MSAESALKQSTGLNGFCDEGQTNQSITPLLAYPAHTHPPLTSLQTLIDGTQRATCKCCAHFIICCGECAHSSIEKYEKAAGSVTINYSKHRFRTVLRVQRPPVISSKANSGRLRTSSWSTQAAHLHGLPRPHIFMVYPGPHIFMVYPGRTSFCSIKDDILAQIRDAHHYHRIRHLILLTGCRRVLAGSIT